jgi:hypothetical protein
MWGLYPHTRLRADIFAQIWETPLASHRRLLPTCLEPRPRLASARSRCPAPGASPTHRRSASACARHRPASARVHLRSCAPPGPCASLMRRPASARAWPPTLLHRAWPLALCTAPSHRVPDARPLVLQQPDMVSSSTPPPPLQPAPPRAPPRPGRPAAPAQVRSSRRATASMPQSVPPRSLACPGSSTTPPDHRAPSSTSAQHPPTTQLELFEFDVSNWRCMDSFKLKLKAIFILECQIGYLKLRFQEIRMNLWYIWIWCFKLELYGLF